MKLRMHSAMACDWVQLKCAEILRKGIVDMRSNVDANANDSKLPQHSQTYCCVAKKLREKRGGGLTPRGKYLSLN